VIVYFYPGVTAVFAGGFVLAVVYYRVTAQRRSEAPADALLRGPTGS
jgi:hypothetical protein